MDWGAISSKFIQERMSVKVVVIIIIIKQSFITRLLISTYHENERIWIRPLVQIEL